METRISWEHSDDGSVCLATALDDQGHPIESVRILINWQIDMRADEETSAIAAAAVEILRNREDRRRSKALKALDAAVNRDSFSGVPTDLLEYLKAQGWLDERGLTMAGNDALRTFNDER